jgi:predicted ribosome quality control (RQC) complex YloA/Tae2 family protein
MALDGMVIANVAQELETMLTGGRITKIAQPEKDELLLTVKQSRFCKETGATKRSQHRLVISVNPSLPLIYLTEETKTSPMTAPTFCMVLRKHLNNCKITKISQLGLERVLCFELEHLNEMGDLCHKHLYVELMGKHSNIIFCDETDTIIDSIKHISLLVSSVREVLPGRTYFIPNTQEKADPFQVTKEVFCEKILEKPMTPAKAIYTSLTGFSPVMANELLHRASLSERENTREMTETEKLHLYRNFQVMMEEIQTKNFQPEMICKGDEPIEFAALPLTGYRQDSSCRVIPYESASRLLSDYYAQKEIYARIHQKSFELRRVTTTALERCRKKYDLQEKQLKDTEKRDKYKVYGELLTTYGYSLKGGEKKLVCDNYYTGKEISIPLDETKSAMENAKRYFEKYAKLKRTFEALSVQIEETKEEISHLESISNALDIARQESDLSSIKRELTEYGYMKKHGGTGKKEKGRVLEKSKPFHFLSSDGFHIYVGRNNYQNDELTFHFANGGDWWFHAKGMAGSHVIVKTQGKELPDRTFEEAASLAAWFSKAKDQTKVEIDYLPRKNVKKPNGSKPGFVVYYTNYSMTITPDISHLREIEEK